MKIHGYYFITDAKLSRAGNISNVKSALKAGVSVVQYRNKDGSTQEMYGEALKLKAICKKGGAVFLINDRVDIALAVDADGVHIGTDDMPYKVARKLLGSKKIIGVTIHNIEEARQAQRSGADYIGASPVFLTDTKPDAGVPAGIDLVRNVKGLISIPIIAIGGINFDNAEEVIAAGADGICAISAVLTKPDVCSEIKRFQRLFHIKIC
jgi:thiamine-phosphate pyrophosphorylase